MRFASAYLGLIGLLSLARAMPMNQQPGPVDRITWQYIYVVEFLEKPPPTMANPPSTEVDLVKSVVASVSEAAKAAVKAQLEERANEDRIYQVDFKNDYPFPQLRPIIYYSASKRCLKDHKYQYHWVVYGWVGTVQDARGNHHGDQYPWTVEHWPSPWTWCDTCTGRHFGLS
ncbi:hypothetical protein DFJ43DRAFT_1097894 [Lentinula guzmanii]|uniref:Uncharacterized protein n=1 Tax=Lentinula guzmanii TaxID=2804957 RepID=A0AA38JAA2_9AGAR|nr:hypothetical protein DFJ43DRAFT_1097894 [Lentinula guzmanii]